MSKQIRFRHNFQNIYSYEQKANPFYRINTFYFWALRGTQPHECNEPNSKVVYPEAMCC